MTRTKKSDLLSQNEADDLLALGKWLSQGDTVELRSGANRAYDLDSTDSSEKFILDLWRGTITLRARYQTRARKTVILARLDLDGAPHTNPNGQRIGCPHIHLYREDFDARWAFPLDPAFFRDPGDLARAFDDFCRYCNIRTPKLESTPL